MDLSDAELVSKIAALQGPDAAAAVAAEGFFASLEADNIGALAAVLSRVLASRAATAADFEVAALKLKRCTEECSVKAWLRWKGLGTPAHVALQASLQRSLQSIEDEEGAAVPHLADSRAFRAVKNVARVAFATVKESWPLLLPRLMTSAADASAGEWLRTAAFDLIAAWLDVLDKARMRVPRDKRRHMLTTIAAGLSPDRPAPVHRGAVQALESFLPFATYLFERADERATLHKVFASIGLLLRSGRREDVESIGAVADATRCLTVACTMAKDASDGLAEVLPVLAPLVLHAAQEGAAAGDKQGTAVLVEAIQFWNVVATYVESAEDGGVAPAPLTRAALEPLTVLLLDAMARQPSEDEPCAEDSIEDAAGNCLCALSHVAADALVPFLAPIVEEALHSADWHHREAAVMASASVCMFDEDDTAPECVMAFARAMVARFAQLLSGPEKDASAYVRETTSYAFWVLIEHEQIRKSVCGRGAGAAVIVPALAAVLQDVPRVAKYAASAMSELLGEKGVFSDEMLRSVWAVVPALIARIDARDAKARPNDVVDMRGAFDSFIQASIEACDWNAHDLIKLLEEAAARLTLLVGAAPALGDGAVAPGEEGGGMEVEDLALGDVALRDKRSRALSVLRLADNLAPVASPVSEALAARLFDGALALLEGALAAGASGAPCAKASLALLSTVASSLDGDAAIYAPPAHLLERMPRVHAQLLARLAPFPVMELDPTVRDDVEELAKEATAATLCVAGALRDAAGQFVPEYIAVCADTAAAHALPVEDRLRAATALGGFALSVPAVTAPLVPRCVAAITALCSCRELLDEAGGSGDGGMGDKDGEGGDSEEDEEEDEEAIERLARSRLCVLRALRRLFDCARRETGEGARQPDLEPLIGLIAASAATWSVGPAAFLSLDDEDEEEEEDGNAPDSVAAALLELLMAASRCVGAAVAPHFGQRTPWVRALLERAARGPGKALRLLAASAAKREGLPGGAA